MGATSISIIIPVLNEEHQVPPLLTYLEKLEGKQYLKEIIIVDGGSTDKTIEIASRYKVEIIKSQKGRAIQMNTAAKIAKGSILYFLHADTLPPGNLFFAIDEAAKVAHAGCFRLKFQTKSNFLKANAWFTRFDINAIRFGDQSLFVKKEVFDAIGGFDEKHVVLEDQEIVKRIKRRYSFKVLPHYVSTSDRKYQANGNLRLQTIFFAICALYHFGASQERLVQFYKKYVKAPNI